MTKLSKSTSLIFTLFFLFSMVWAQKPDSVKVKKYTNKEDNAACLKCHGNHKYSIPNEDSSKMIKYRMCSNFVIDTAVYYQSNHWNFKCFDCHSDEYAQAPHKPELRLQQTSTCMDCHGGDANYAKYNFEKIEKEFNQSAHSSRHNENFSCWSCHDAHTYKINARNKTQNIKNTISYDNSICLSCHANFEKYQLYRDSITPNIIAKHDWLPNQTAHFKSVRCIECHASYDDSILVAHDIMPKEKAVRRCVECHSTNSILTQSLYKYEIQEKRSKNGFFNTSIIESTFVIGANRNYFLNLASGAMLILAFTGIFIHVLLRIITKNKKHHGK